MIFRDDLTKEEYKNFWKNNINQHFINSYEWGILNKEHRKQDPIYVGLEDKGKLIAATLLLKRNTPFNMCYYYAARGFLIDWDNKELVKTFTNSLKEYLVKTNAIYLKVDPDIMYQEVDKDAKKVDGGKNNYELFNYLISLGYVHQGFNKLYEKNQPRYTFRTYFDKYDTFEDVEKDISKTFMRTVKRSYNYDLVIEEYGNVDDFYKLEKNIARKADIKGFEKKYYKDVIDLFSKDGYVKNFIAKINPKHIVSKYENLLKDEKNEDRKVKIKKDIDYYKGKIREDDEYVIASLICIYTEIGAWSLYIGNDDIAEYSGTVNRLYYEFIKDAYESKKKYADLFGVVGDPKTTYKNLAGIYEYKRKMGGDLIEFIGEFDLINKPFIYKILPILLKFYRKIKK